MRTHYEYNLVWKISWDTSNTGKVYTSTEIDFFKKYSFCKSLSDYARDFNRKVSAVALKLKNLGVLNFDSSSQNSWNIIHEHQADISVKELQNYLTSNNCGSKPAESNKITISGNQLIDNTYSAKNTDVPTGGTDINPIKEKTMKRRTVIVELFDDTQGLDVKHSRVLSKEVVTESDSDNAIIQQMLLESGSYNVSDAIKAHNELRSKTVDEKILQNTGNEVMLREVKIEDLRWSIR